MLARDAVYKNYDDFKKALQNPQEFKKEFISQIEKEINHKKNRLKELEFKMDRKDLEKMELRLKEIENIKINEVENAK